MTTSRHQREPQVKVSEHAAKRPDALVPMVESGAQIRRSLTVGRADDVAEREADAVAEAVMRSLHRFSSAGGRSGGGGNGAANGEGGGDGADSEGAMHAPVRRSSSRVDRLGGHEVSDDVDKRIESMRGRGSGIPAVDRAPMEQAFGRSFSGVTAHTDSAADTISRQLDATAFTVGSDVFFTSGAYEPGSDRGRSLLAHELAHVEQHSGGRVRRSTVIRRRFGLEIELQKVFAGGVGVAPKKLGPVAKNETFATESKLHGKYPIVGAGAGGGFDIHVDHSDTMGGRLPVFDRSTDSWVPNPGKGPIIELVTKPFDEFTQTNVQIGAVMTDMANLATQMASTSNSQSFATLGVLGPADNFVGNSPPTMKQGLLGAALPAPKSGGQVQVTMGVRLDRIKQLLELQGGAKDDTAPPPVVGPPVVADGGGPPPPPPPMGMPPPVKGGSSPNGTANLKGAEIANSISDALFVRYNDAKTYQVEDKDDPTKLKTKTRTFKNKFTISDQSELADFKGFIAMMANYLVAGKSDLGFGWGKNKVGGLFYKSKMSDLRNAITGEAHTVIKERQSKIKKMLLAATERSTAEAVLLNREGKTTPGSVTCGAWLDAVFDGKDDPLFATLKNDYASDISPEMVGPVGQQHMGAVIENRNIGELLRTMVPTPNGAVVTGRASTDWSPIATGVADMLRVLNGTNTPDRTAMNTAVGR